jgi:transposase
MPKPLSNDLRERVVAFVEAGNSRRAAAAHFQVSASFVVNLMKLYRQTGGVEPRALGGRRHAKLAAQRDFILAQVAARPDITMPELAAELRQATDTKADPASLSRWLIRNGYRFKKNSQGQRARQARDQKGTRRMARLAPAAHGAPSAPAGVYR